VDPAPTIAPLATGFPDPPPPVIVTVATSPLTVTAETPAPVKFIVLPLPTTEPFF